MKNKGIKMKKIVKSIVAPALVCAALTSSASAGFINYKALDMMNVNVGASLMSMDSTSAVGLNYGFGMMKYTENFAFGWNYNFDMPSDTSVSDSYGSFEADVGYRLDDKKLVYGIFSYDVDSNSFAGIGYGVGGKYQLMNHIAVDTRIKYTKMSPLAGNVDYDYIKATINLEFNFRTSEGKPSNEDKYRRY
jgi:opacity protein-like surface antigen